MNSVRALVIQNFEEDVSDVLRVLNDVVDVRSTSRTYVLRKSLIELSHGSLNSLKQLVKECSTVSDVQYLIGWARQIRELKFQNLIGFLLSRISAKALSLSLEVRCEHGAALLAVCSSPTQLAIIPVGDDEAFITNELDANLAPRTRASMQQFDGIFVSSGTSLGDIEDLLDKVFLRNDRL